MSCLLAVHRGASAILGPLALGGEAVALDRLLGAVPGGLGLGLEALRSGGGLARVLHGGIEGSPLVGCFLDRSRRRLRPGPGRFGAPRERRQLLVGLGQPRLARQERIERA
ncbi:MAG TPA: hypothetical protein VF257_16295, partial [Solirubrobacteraceae bacterium]